MWPLGTAEKLGLSWQADAVFKRFVAFEKQQGDREGIEVRNPKPCAAQ